MTENVTEFTAPFEIYEETANEVTGNTAAGMSTEQAILKFNMLEIVDFERLAPLIPNATYVASATKPMITGGGKILLPVMPVAIIAPRRDAPTKFIVVLIYAGYNTQGARLAFTKNERSAMPSEIRGLSVGTRPAGDQIWQAYYEV